MLSPSTGPRASESSSELASGAVAGIAIAAVVAVALVGGLLVYGIMRARRKEGIKTKAMLPMKGYGAPEVGTGSMTMELDGKRKNVEVELDGRRHVELPSQQMRHEMI
ncbi:MAG: hypothetical protein Q9164_003164 [Protoblastenia rupestris]